MVEVAGPRMYSEHEMGDPFEDVAWERLPEDIVSKLETRRSELCSLAKEIVPKLRPGLRDENPEAADHLIKQASEIKNDAAMWDLCREAEDFLVNELVEARIQAFVSYSHELPRTGSVLHARDWKPDPKRPVFAILLKQHWTDQGDLHLLWACSIRPSLSQSLDAAFQKHSVTNPTNKLLPDTEPRKVVAIWLKNSADSKIEPFGLNGAGDEQKLFGWIKARLNAWLKRNDGPVPTQKQLLAEAVSELEMSGLRLGKYQKIHRQVTDTNPEKYADFIGPGRTKGSKNRLS